MSFKVREAHWQILVEEMEKNPVIATGKFIGPRGKEHYKKSWNETARKLNALGFGSKSTEKWQKTWVDYKYNLKKKAAAVKKSISQTGGGPTEEKDLTELELKLLDMLDENFIGLEEPECGLPASLQLNIFGDPQPSTSRDEPAASPQFNIIEEPQPGTSRDEPTPVPLTPSKRKRKINISPSSPRKRVPYLSEYRETINELRDIKTTIKNSLDGISQNLCDLTSEVRQLNNNLVQILQAQQIFYQDA